MSEVDEVILDKQCAAARSAALSACGDVCSGADKSVHHIILMSAAGSIIAVAATTLIRDATGENVEPDDPRAVALARDWMDALKAYPDNRAMGAAMDVVREKVFKGLAG